jgi:HPt (histidine-containing phosphotransfer) domain-containing protein
MQGEAQRCRERGMDDYLSKPLRLTELGPMLTKWLPQLTESASALSAEQSPPRLQGAVDALPIWNPSTLADLVGDNPALHQRLLSKFLLNAKIQVEAVLTGASAGDLDAAANAAHTLKSAARSVGALALGELCDDIETAGRAADSVACLAGVTLLSATFARAAQQIEAALAAPQPEANQPFGALA